MHRPGLALASLLLLALGAVADPPDDTVPPSAARLTNVDDVRRRLGLFPNYPTVPRIGDVKVAVLDSGFEGIDGKRPYLPKSATVVEHYDPDFVRRNGLGDPAFQKPFLPGNIHGRLMAQIVWETSGKSPHGPRFYLLNANGPTMFRRAVRYAIEQKVDVILFSGTFEGAGNYDGRGPINAAVSEAVAAGIIWVNATGNCGGMVYNGPVDVGPGGYLRFAAGRGREPDLTALRLANRLDESAVTVTLTWNDYREAEDAGTDKDLDLIVENWQGKVVGASRLKQIPAGRAAGDGETTNPRERVVLLDLAATPPGREYRIRVKANTANFGPRDRIRILVSPARTAPVTDPETGKQFAPVALLDASRRGEIYPPADHPGVLTVGDMSQASAVGPTADGRVKPDVLLLDSLARFSNGEETTGSSNAAAYFAGIVAVLRATEPGLTTGHLRQWVRAVDRERTESRPAPATVRPVEPPVLLSPNQQRALRYSEYAVEEKRLRGETNPQVIVSSGSGPTLLVRPGSTTPPPVARAAPPASVPEGVFVHTPWLTPNPRSLSDLVRGR